MENKKTDVVIVGSGVAGLYCALNLPRDKNILIITKEDLKSSDSFLAQGGICVLRDDSDYDSFMEDTLKAGHYKNRRESVDIMIRSSRNHSRSHSIWSRIHKRKWKGSLYKGRSAFQTSYFIS